MYQALFVSVAITKYILLQFDHHSTGDVHCRPSTIIRCDCIGREDDLYRVAGLSIEFKTDSGITSSQHFIPVTSLWNSNCGSTFAGSPLISIVDRDPNVTAWFAFRNVNYFVDVPTMDCNIFTPISHVFSNLTLCWAIMPLAMLNKTHRSDWDSTLVLHGYRFKNKIHR